MMITEIDKLKIAEELLKIKAVVIRPENPFRWSSGIISPIYCDNRKTLSYPKIRTSIRNAFVEIISHEFGKPDVIAGVATGGIAQGALVAQEMGLPFVYVRPEPKKHGMENSVEGYLHSGQSVVVVEDLISTGGSSLKAIQALKENGGLVKGLVAIFTYGFQDATENFKKENVIFHTLTDYASLLKVALEKNYINDHQFQILQDWSKNPKGWHG
ncbi:MAG: orotate phosphoribosyltransferase [Bacteroidia bacterium]|nr:orotate phosphoribosyltransferase [Bacteroidia bacterium]